MSEDPAIRTETGRFVPGVSGNPNGRPKDQFSFMGILRSALAEENKSGKSVGERIIARYIKLALAGNGQALEALVARIDGKPAQSLTLKGESDAPLHVRHSARLEQEAKPKLVAPAGEVDMPDALRRTLASANRLQAPEQEQEAAEGEVASTVTIKRHMLLDAGVPGDLERCDYPYCEAPCKRKCDRSAPGLRDPDHQAPDAAE